MKCVLLCLLLFGWMSCPLMAISFDVVQWDTEVSSSQQCGSDGGSDPMAALQTVAQLIQDTANPTSLPNSCMEIKESSPVSPSGYYTISSGSSDSGVIVYCNMDDLSSCPALEQTLNGFKKDVQQALSGLNEDVDSLEQTVSEVKEDVDSLNQTVSGFNKDVEQTLNGIKDDVDLLTDVEQTLNGIKEDVDSLTDVEQTLNGFKEGVEQTLSEIKEDVGSLSTDIGSSLASSCSEVQEKCPDCESGVYQIAPDLNSVKFVYCAFENSTYCNIMGPWVKVASWDISEPGSSCPDGLQLFVNGTVSACGIPEGSSAGCRSLPLFSSPMPYSQVCGRTKGYQKGSGDAFWGPLGSGIDDPYMDGVSITRGSPRQHIWTFAIGVQENLPIGNLHQCPCVPGNPNTPPAFVGSDYFCESGCPGFWDGFTFHAADPLWDGDGCGDLEEQCCAAPSLPWFHKVLDTATTDSIEMRVCLEEDTTNENALIGAYEIYVL